MGSVRDYIIGSGIGLALIVSKLAITGTRDAWAGIPYSASSPLSHDESSVEMICCQGSR